jgi:hypothetical protein
MQILMAFQRGWTYLRRCGCYDLASKLAGLRGKSEPIAGWKVGCRDRRHRHLDADKVFSEVAAELAWRRVEGERGGGGGGRRS